MRFGVTFAQYGTWSSLAERVARYEALGFDTVWVADHFVFPWDPTQPWFDGWSLLAGLAAQTTRIRLGPMVTHAIYRNPAVLARTAMTVDHLSNGRLDLGIGTGASDYDWTMTSGSEPWPFAERVDRFAEVVEIVDGLLRRSLHTYKGRYYQVADVNLAPGPVQQPRPRLVVGAGGPRMVKLAARYADAWVTEGMYRELWGTNPTMRDVLRIARDRSALLSEQAAVLGRDPKAIGRVFLAGFSPGTEKPWASVGAFEEIVGQYHEVGFDEFIFLEPVADEWSRFERIVAQVLPRPPSP